MKYIQLIAFLFVLGLSGCGTLCTFAQTKALNVSLRFDSDLPKEEFITSGKLNVPFLELVGAVDFKNLKWNYGASLSTQKLFQKVQISFKTGNLSDSGSISKLNSPSLSSSISSFQSSSIRISKLDISLPQYNSYSNLQSYFLEAQIKPGKIFKQFVLGGFCKTEKDSEPEFTLSVCSKISPFKLSEIAYSATGGIYPYEKKKITSWFTKEPFYHEGNHLCFNNQFSVVMPNFSSLFIVSTYQSPFNEFLNTFRLENLIKFKRFSFNLDCFYNPNDLVITSSNKIIKPLLQVEAGSQYKFLTETKYPVSIMTGINTLANLNLAEKNHTIKTTSGIKYTASDFSGNINATINLKLTNNTDGIIASFTGGSADFSNSIYIKDFTCITKGNFSFTPDSKKTKWTYTEKIGIDFEYEKIDGSLIFSNKNQLTLTQKTGETKNKIGFTSSLSAKAQFRFCSLHVHLEFQV